MSDRLDADLGGLRSGAANSESVAAALADAAAGGGAGSEPSQVGAAAILAAAQAVRQVQSGRVAGQADALTSAASAYESTDQRGAGDLERSM
ncbi:hypothetical protein [Mycobacterium hubeiense]|uniref:hypothetical protein n=1 Tax=Mycobacterium hubeiense TaxID=1867256 RepID=UPI00115AA27F|nr:hypothetical protein [Mycobacterium sp. QGD 101]